MADFAVWTTTDDTVTLGWTAPGDDGMDGYATLYDARYLPGEPVSDSNWALTHSAFDEPVPGRAGSPEQFTVIGLTEGTTYYFAGKAVDDSDNTSGISPSVAATTDLADPGDWVKEDAYCEFDPDSREEFACQLGGLWKGLDVFDDGDETRVAIGVSHGAPRLAERVGGIWAYESASDDAATGVDTAYSQGGSQAPAFYQPDTDSLVLATTSGSNCTIETIDTEAKDPKSGGADPALAYDPVTGEPTVAYSAATGKGRKQNTHVRFARCAPSGWQIDEIVEADVGEVDLAYDAAGNPAIAFSDASGESPEVKVARWSGSWGIEVAGSGYPSVNYVTLAFDPVVDDPVIVLWGGLWDRLFLLRYDIGSSSWDETQIAEELGLQVIHSPSLAIDSSGVFYVSFANEIPSEERIGNGQIHVH
jgi:hypothetical protein